MSLFRQTRRAFLSFWEKHPALWIGLSLLLGTSYAFNPLPLFVAIWGVLALCVQNKRAVLWGLLACSGAYIGATLRHPTTLLAQEKVSGKGRFHITEVKPYSSPFNHSILYKGTLLYFEEETGNCYNKLPCALYLPMNGSHPVANTDYEIQGTLSQKGPYAFVLKPEKNRTWEPLPSFLNLSAWRFATKQQLFQHLKTQFQDPKVLSLLYSLTSGHVDERVLKMEFNKLGLQHILAISGFHFALFALFLGGLLKLFLPHKISLVLLLLGLSAYALFLGNSPAIQRAFIAISVVVIGKLLERRSSGLNALGIGIIAELLLSPLSVLELGFQLSFLCTLAILLFYPTMQTALGKLFEKREAREVLRMPLVHQHGYLLCSFFRTSLALNLAVHFISIPVLLYQFHRFPLLSIAYNLFFPAALSLSMFLLFFAFLLFPLLPLASHWIHQVNHAWTAGLLSLTSNPPAFLDLSFGTQALTLSWVLCFLTSSFLLGIFFFKKERGIS